MLNVSILLIASSAKIFKLEGFQNLKEQKDPNCPEAFNYFGSYSFNLEF